MPGYYAMRDEMDPEVYAKRVAAHRPRRRTPPGRLVLRFDAYFAAIRAPVVVDRPDEVAPR